jgi:hypothetical protein
VLAACNGGSNPCRRGDAGRGRRPQVKILCPSKDAGTIVALVSAIGGIQTILYRPGPGPQYGHYLP